MKWFVTVFAVVASRSAHGDPIVLSMNALATTTSPAGLVTVSADTTAGPNVAVEAVVWTGGGGDLSGETPGDVLVMVARARTDDGMASGQLGRFVAVLGALRPVHVDGASARVRILHEVDVEAYAGVPVLTGITTSRAWDWITAGRLSRRVGDWGSFGVAYLQQRTDGLIDAEEVALDAGATIGKHDDVGARFAYDLATLGVAEATLSASHRHGPLRTELFATYRAASHLLPATSLFSVLGDVPAAVVGATVTWRAAPRLDVVGDFAIRYSDGDPIDGPAAIAVSANTSSAMAPLAGSIAPEGYVRATLRLDDRGTKAIGGELRHEGVGDAGWTGIRGTARVALPFALAVSTELELVIPDYDRGLGAVWPWALVALSWNRGPWQAAVALEASASPEDRSRLDTLAQLGHTWGTR